jgi:hypothetical protein
MSRSTPLSIAWIAAALCILACSPAAPGAATPVNTIELPNVEPAAAVRMDPAPDADARLAAPVHASVAPRSPTVTGPAGSSTSRPAPAPSPASASATTLPWLAEGTCPWGHRSDVPPLSRFAQQVRTGGGRFGAAFVQRLDLQHRILFARANVEHSEWILQCVAQQTNAPDDARVYMTAEAYAELESVEADLCVKSSFVGLAQDTAAAKSARQRMDDLCAQLQKTSRPTFRCP